MLWLRDVFDGVCRVSYLDASHCSIIDDLMVWSLDISTCATEYASELSEVRGEVCYPSDN